MSNDVSREAALANLPDLPEGWGYRALEDLVEPDRSIAYGIVQPGPFVADGVPIIRVQDVHDSVVDTSSPLRVASPIEAKYRRTRLHGGELLVTLVGTVGMTAVAHADVAGWNVARAIGVVPIRSEIGAKFVSYALRIPDIQELMAAWCNTTVQATLNLKELARVPVPLPPAEERARITELLSALDDKISLDHRVNYTLQSAAAALFQSWFVNFEPVVAKAENRRASGVPTLVQEALASCFADSPAGLIPEGWRLGSVAEIADVAREQVAPHDIAPDTPYIAMEHMPRRSIALDSWEPAGRVESAKFLYRRGDVLFGKLRPYFHKVGLAPNDGVCSTEILVLRAVAPEWYGPLACIASSDDFVEYASSAAEGTRMPRVSWGYLSRYALPLPPTEIADHFTRMVRPMFELIIANVHEIRSLSALRDTLLQPLLSGAMRVRTAERAVAEAI